MEHPTIDSINSTLETIPTSTGSELSIESIRFTSHIIQPSFMPSKTLVENTGVAWRDWIGNNKIKCKLQFSGWLQYAPIGILSVVTLVTGCLVVSDRNESVSSVLSALGTAGLGVFVYDVLTAKLQVRPFDMPIDRKRFKDASDIQVMVERHSCRSFQTQLLTSEDRDLILKLASEMSKPGALLGKERKSTIRFEYIQAPLTVWPAVGAREFLVAIAPKEYNRQAIVNVGRALEHVVLEATRRGIATCWIGPGTDQNSVIQALGPTRFDVEHDHIILSCAFGYQSYYVPIILRLVMATVSQSRMPLGELFFQDVAMKVPANISQPPLRDYAPCMEACRWSPSSFNAQPVRAICILVDNKKLLERIDFYALGPSKYYSVVALGIWLRHWETACRELGLKGHFNIVEAATRGYTSPENHTYDISWIVSNN